MIDTAVYVKAGRVAIIMAWCAAFAVALALDRPVGRFVQESGLAPALKSKDWHWLTRAGRLGGNFLTFSLPVALILAARGRKWLKAAAFVFVGGALSGVAQLLKWMVGRPRPFNEDVFTIHPFIRGWDGLRHEVNLSFPSGDVCLAAATAGCLNFLFPRWRGLWIAIVCIVALERVSEGAHYPSDVVAAAGLGLVMAHLARWVFGIEKEGKE